MVTVSASPTLKLNKFLEGKLLTPRIFKKEGIEALKVAIKGLGTCVGRTEMLVRIEALLSARKDDYINEIIKSNMDLVPKGNVALTARVEAKRADLEAQVDAIFAGAKLLQVEVTPKVEVPKVEVPKVKAKTTNVPLTAKEKAVIKARARKIADNKATAKNAIEAIAEVA